MKTSFYLALLAAMVCVRASADIYTNIFTGPFTDNGGAGAGIIPDNSPIGLTAAETLSGEMPTISDLSLTVTIQGNFAADLTGYLRLGDQPTSLAYDLTPTLSAGNSTFTMDVGSLFDGQDPNNTWTLFFADTSPGGQNSLQSWELDVTATPEPSSAALAGLGGLLLLIVRFCRTK